jgi:hypothetical protein
MTRHAVIDTSSEKGTEKIAQGSKKENQADLVKLAGSIFGKLKKCRTLRGDGETQKNKGKIICGSSNVFLIHADLVFPSRSFGRAFAGPISVPDVIFGILVDLALQKVLKIFLLNGFKF